jgi:hypothetical protein
VEAFLSGLAVRSQGPYFVRGSRGPDRDAPRSAGRAPRVPHTDAELATARERLNPGQDTLDLGDVATVAPGVEDVADWTAGRRAGQATLDENLDQAGHSRQSMTSKSWRSTGGRPASFNAGGRVVATSSQLLWQVLTDAYTRLGLDVLADEAFRAMVLAQIVEPASKADSLRVLADLGAPAPELRTLFRSLQRCRASDYRDGIANPQGSTRTSTGRAPGQLPLGALALAGQRIHVGIGHAGRTLSVEPPTPPSGSTTTPAPTDALVILDRVRGVIT